MKPETEAIKFSHKGTGNKAIVRGRRCHNRQRGSGVTVGRKVQETPHNRASNENTQRYKNWAKNGGIARNLDE